MNHLPIIPPSPEEQQKIHEQLYLLMGKQVEQYHKHRRMGSNSSVPVELAQALMESIEYTLGLVGGVYAHRSVEASLVLGQEILESRLAKARSMLELVTATAPRWQTECRWDALRYLAHYLDRYDLRHLAHQGPDDLYYPILISPPEGIRGIDSCLFYLNILWIENQIMAGIPESALEQFWDRLPAGALNQCEYLLINGIGKALLGSSLVPLIFEPKEHEQLVAVLMTAAEETLKDAANRLCQWLDLKDENARMYAQAAVPQLAMWIGDRVRIGNPDQLFL